MKAEERRFSRSVFIRPHSSLFLLPQKDRAEIALQLLELIGGRIIHEDHVAGDFLRLLCQRINARERTNSPVPAIFFCPSDEQMYSIKSFAAFGLAALVLTLISLGSVKYL